MISIVIPVYNSEKILPKLCDLIHKEMKSHELIYELILVNDGSKDNSEDIIKSLSKKYEQVKGVLLKNNVGQQLALLAGLRQAKYHNIVTMDDDLQHHPKDIIRLISHLDEKSDVVYGVPFNDTGKTYRKLGTHIKEMCFFVFLGKPRNLRLTSFRVMKKHVLDWVIKDPLPNVYISARILKYTKKIKNLNINYREREQGKSNYTFVLLTKKLLKSIWNYKVLYLWYKRRPCTHQYIIKEIV
ncbi:glycosyltransferase [Oceanirhabdus sp. W0125-5]|uniref:glycosyltransferase n=1 Tax=Oceanirhabdus sp. W0125-5 TaxID=2999116 RepID=UPI0022F2CABB|nr:glycosyltransferase [Oceanirhabdus sp. W0125-5]WBW98865.1 glycosyltransferase [Oceanirhabdus sp. W0125-5]